MHYCAPHINGQETGTVTDIDGNIYQTVKIDYQWWMAENLRVSKYRNGDQIPNVTSNTDWGNLTIGAWAYYENNQSNDPAYGKLYNWHAVADERDVCPAGWHIPDNEAWKQLELYLGMTDEEAEDAGWRGETDSVGGKLKSILTEPQPHPRWDSPNTAATNESRLSTCREGTVIMSASSGFWVNTAFGGVRRRVIMISVPGTPGWITVSRVSSDTQPVSMAVCRFGV
jgi:uncharacterized protein (TIGR02145 family)